jgi:hypothetical protein
MTTCNRCGVEVTWNDADEAYIDHDEFSPICGWAPIRGDEAKGFVAFAHEVSE